MDMEPEEEIQEIPPIHSEGGKRTNYDNEIKRSLRLNGKAQENGVESSDDRSKPQSKGMIFKRNTPRKQHKSQTDDPGELSPDVVELERVLEDCVFVKPVHVRDIDVQAY